MAEKPAHEKINQKEMLPKNTLAQWHPALDAINDAVCLLDMNGKILQCNKAMETLLKKSSEEIIGSTCWELVLGTDKPVKGCPIVRMKKTLCRETLVVKVDDKWLNVTVDPLIDETGNLTSAVHIISDITRRKRAEEAQRETEAKYRALYDNAPLSYQSLNENGCFIDINPAWVRTIGYEKEEVIGKWFGNFLHPDWKPHFEKNFPEFKRRGFVHDVQFKMRHKDGHYLDISFEGYIGYTPDGKFKQTYCVFQDITERKQAEKTLRECERKFREMVELLPEAVYECDAQRNVTFANKAAFEKFCLTREDLDKGVNAQQFIAPDDRKRAEENIEKILRGIKRGPFEYIALRKDGSEFPVTTHSSPIISDGRPVGLRGIVIDITERKKREEAIKETKERYRCLSEASFEAIFISEKGVCLEQNSTAEKMFGYTLSEAIGRKGVEWIVPDDREMVMNNMLSGYEEPYETTALRKDGSTFLAEIQGKMMHYKGRSVRVTALNDITKRKQAEEGLRKSEQRFRSIFENIPNIAVQGYDADRKIIFWNQASEKLYGYKKEEAIGNQLEDLIIPFEMRESVIEAVRNWVENGIPIPHGELKLMRKDKTTFPVYSSHVILKNINGELEMYCIDIDMTERNQAEGALLNSKKMLHYLSSQLITAQEKERRRISLELHDEMGQVLTAISINIRSIEKELPLGHTPLIKERIAEIYSLADQASGQIRELSHYLRPSMLDDLGLVPTLRWYLDVYRKRTRLDVKHELINFEERQSPEVETVIYRVVQEALNNIAKHAQAGSVLVRLELKDKEAAVFIKDNGRGFEVNEFLAPDDLKGGIGLLGMQERVSILGGKFSIQSSKGDGTRISVKIPLH